MYGSLAFRLDIPERGLWRKYHHFRGRQLWFRATTVASWRAKERGVELVADTDDPFQRQLSISIVFLDEAIFQLQATLSDTTSLIGFAHSFDCPADELFFRIGRALHGLQSAWAGSPGLVGRWTDRAQRLDLFSAAIRHDRQRLWHPA